MADRKIPKTMELYSKKYRYLCAYSAKSGCSSMRRLFLKLHKEEAGIDSSVGFRIFPRCTMKNADR
jgi:hypothetical protein